MTVELTGRLATELADRYLIEEEVGRGSSATVFLAQDLRHGRRVALKVLHSALGAALGMERFQREIRTAARLQHPHILPLLDSGTAAGQLFYTMPYVETGSLRDRLRREGRLPVPAVRQLAGEVASALSYAHALGVIHRDIKPENILISVTGHALLTDFGIAYALDEGVETTGDGPRLTETGITLGTPAYMSPEQSAGDEPVDSRSDLYSLAAVVYEALAGTPPFTGRNARAIIARRLVEAPPLLREARPDTPPAVERAVQRAMSRYPADRFESAAEFAAALAVPEPPAPPPSRISPPVRRQLLRLGGAAVVAVGLLLGAVLLGRRFLAGRPAEVVTGQRMIAVLPFKNLGAAEDQYFTDGLTEEITSRLAGLTGLRVISRTSADQYRGSGKPLREIGAELGAGYVLEGSVRWERGAPGPGRVRVTPQLIRVADDSHLWAESYDAELTEVFRIQSSIAQQVTTALDVALREPELAALGARGTSNLEAYDFFLRGNEYLGRGNQLTDLSNAVALYQRAVTADSGFVQAWAKLARTHAQIYWHHYDRSAGRIDQVRTAVAAAARLGPDLPETHMAQGFFRYYVQRDFAGGLQEFEQALRGQPSNAELLRAIAYIERRRGRWAESTGRFTEALRYDPRSGALAFDIGDNYFSSRMYSEAEHYLDRAIALSPDWANPYAYKAELYLSWRGDLPRARAVLGQALNRVAAAGLAPALSTGDRISAAIVASDSTFWPMIDGLSLGQFLGDSSRYYLLKAETWYHRGDLARQRAYADSARALVAARMRSDPEDPWSHAVLGLSYAFMGRGAEAIREGRAATDLMPLSDDAVSGPYIQTNLARIYMYAGELGPAVEILEKLLTIPCWISPAELRADPTWAPLRKFPRFQKLSGL